MKCDSMITLSSPRKSTVGGAAQKNVLVFINGGYCNSMLELEPDFFMAQDVILVHIHYRVGIYGFLNLDHAGITGNMGLKDQQLGMKWVYENIEKFSGKKDAILLFGHGKGKLFKKEKKNEYRFQLKFSIIETNK